MSTNLRFKTNKQGNVRLIILNLIGLKVEELTAGYMKQGEHTVAWQPKFNLSGAVLNYKIELNKKVVGENMFIVR